MNLQSLLLPQLQAELENTRTVIANLPTVDFSWKPHVKSMSIANLADLSDLPYLVT